MPSRRPLFGLIRPVAAVVGVIIACAASTPMDAMAQNVGTRPESTGTLVVADWPSGHISEEDLASLRRDPPGPPFSNFEVLSYVDSLFVDYRLGVAGGNPFVELDLRWTQGERVLIDGRSYPAVSIRGDVAVIALDLSFRLHGGDDTAELVVRGSDFVLFPGDESVTVRYEDEWRHFLNRDEASTRALMASGPALDEPQVVRIGFAQYPAEPSRRSRRATRSTVFVPDIDIWIRMAGGTRPGHVPVPRAAPGRRSPVDGQGRTTGTEGRRQRPGRTPADTDHDGDEESGRAGRLLGGLSDVSGGDDDDDEEDRLWPAALAGVAGIAAVAVAGGTIGVSTHPARAPFGLAAGFRRNGGGMWLSVGVNAAVLGVTDGPEELIAQIAGYRRLSRGRVHPMMGLGVLITERDTQGTDLKPSLTLGGLLDAGVLSLVAGYDLGVPGLQAGLLVHWR